MAEDKAFVIAVSIVFIGLAIYCFGVAHGIRLAKRIDDIFKAKKS